MSTIYLYVMLENNSVTHYAEWHNDIGLHREEPHPAVIYAEGSRFWYQDDEYIRGEDGYTESSLLK